MALSYVLKSEKKNVRVYHVFGKLEDGENVEPYVITSRMPQGVVVYNNNNRTAKLETSPTRDGPWVEIATIRRYRNTGISNYSVYTRLKLKKNDTVDLWVTIFKL